MTASRLFTKLLLATVWSLAASSTAGTAAAAPAASWPSLAGPAIGDLCYTAPLTDKAAMTLEVQALGSFQVARGGGSSTLIQTIFEGDHPRDGMAIKLTSDDWRFETLVIDADLGAVRTADGDQLSLFHLVNAFEGGSCRQTFAQTAMKAERPSRYADVEEATPVLANHRLVASWPFSRTRFLALFVPDGDPSQTSLVSFLTDSGGDVRLEADLPFAVQALSVSGTFHGEPWFLTVLGRQSDGSIIEAQFRTKSPGEYP